MSKLDEDFLYWLEDAKWILPPKMSVHEAHQLYNRKVAEEKEIAEIKSDPDSK
jgi:hypothetical protein